MKRLFSILLTLLMIMCFVACGDVTPETNLDDDTPTDTTPTTPSVPETDDEEKIIINLPELPEPEGSDPFINLTELNDENNKILINSESRTMTVVRSFDDDEPYFIEYNYSYKVVDEKINVYLVITKITDLESRELLSIQDYFDSIEGKYTEYCRLDLEDYLGFYDEYFGLEEWNVVINDWNEIYGTNFTEEDFIPENFDEILKISVNAEVVKSDILTNQLKVKNYAEVVRHFVFELSEIDFEDSKAKVSLEGIFDDLKKWYEQPNGCFSDGDSEFSLERNYIEFDLDLVSRYWVTSIDDSKIETTYSLSGESYTKSFDYTILGSGKDAVISIKISDSDTIELIWKPSDTLIVYL